MKRPDSVSKKGVVSLLNHHLKAEVEVINGLIYPYEIVFFVVFLGFIIL